MIRFVFNPSNTLLFPKSTPSRCGRTFAYVPASVYDIQLPERTGAKSLQDLLSAIKISEILKSKHEHSKAKSSLITVNSGSSVLDAIRSMNDNHVGSVLVMKQRELAGIFTERDYLRKIVLQKLASKTTKVEDVMSQPVISATPETNLHEVTGMMAIHKFRHVPIFSSDEVVGIISTRDVIPALINACENSSMDLSVRLNEVFNKLCRSTSPECYVSKDDTVLHALQLMERFKSGAVFVHKGTEVVGIFTEHDYLRKVFLQGRRSPETKVKEVMTRGVVSVSPVQTVMDCLETMKNHRIRNVPIIPMLGDSIDYGEGKYEYSNMGMVTDLDVVKFIHKKM